MEPNNQENLPEILARPSSPARGSSAINVRGVLEELGADGAPSTYTRTKTTHAEYLLLKEKFFTRYGYYGDQLAAVLHWAPGGGIICQRCNADPKLSGPYTLGKPIKSFTWSAVKNHLFCHKHLKRCCYREYLVIQVTKAMDSASRARGVDVNS